jgi:hypothetical protein
MANHASTRSMQFFVTRREKVILKEMERMRA